MTVTALHPARNEIQPATVTTLLARFSVPERSAVRTRRAAAALIRYMDTRDCAAAVAFTAKLGADMDAVMAWVWRIEAERAAHRRVYQASPAWRSERGPAAPPAGLGEAVAVLAEAIGIFPQPPRPRRKSGPAPTQPHGTPAAARRHRRANEYPCALCLNAERDYKAARREEARIAA